LRINVLVLFFCEYRASPVWISFFSRLLNFVVNQLIYTWCALLHSKGKITIAAPSLTSLTERIASFIVRRLKNFTLITKLSGYSFCRIVFQCLVNFLESIAPLLSIKTNLSLLPALSSTSKLHLYSYKFRALSKQSLFLNDTLGINRIFNSDKIPAATFLTEYIKLKNWRQRGSKLKTFKFRKKKNK